MQEEKSWVYTLVLGVCMLLCLLLIGRMLLGTPAAQTDDGAAAPESQGQEGTQVGFTLDEQSLSALLRQALPLQPSEMAVAIRADQTVTVSAAVRRQDLEDSGLVPGSLRTALLFLPDPCRLYGVWTAAIQDGAVALQCREAGIADLTLPEEVTAPLTGQIAAAVNQALTQQKIAPAGIAWEDGRLTLLP